MFSQVPWVIQVQVIHGAHFRNFHGFDPALNPGTSLIQSREKMKNQQFVNCQSSDDALPLGIILFHQSLFCLLLLIMPQIQPWILVSEFMIFLGFTVCQMENCQFLNPIFNVLPVHQVLQPWPSSTGMPFLDSSSDSCLEVFFDLPCAMSFPDGSSQH